MSKNQGFLTYITPDGREYELHTPHDPGRWVLSWQGYGTPSIDYIVQRNAFADGVALKRFFLRPRVLQLLIRQNFCDRQAWWAGRAALLNEIRPNRQTTVTGVNPGTLRLVQTGGTIRSLDVFIESGPLFNPRVPTQWDEWSFQEMVRFVAPDPTIYDPATATASFAITLDADLVFPITFPITFGAGDVDETLNITYPGTWFSLPTIIITGPIERPSLENESTGETIALDSNIGPGRTVTIDLAYGVKTVVDDLGNNLIGTVTPDSDLGTWHLAADPEAPAGVNVIRLRGSNPTAATAVSLAYLVRYFGF